MNEARAARRAMWGIRVMDTREDGGYSTPLDCQGEDDTYVSRIRRDTTVEHGLSFWVISDNLRKGAALNAEALVAQGMLGHKAALPFRA